MANPNEASLQDQIGKAIKILEELRLYGEVSAENFLDHENDHTTNLEGDRATDSGAAVTAFRAIISGLLAPGTGVGILTPHLLDYGKFIDSPSADIGTVLFDLYDFFIANTLTVESRVFTFGTPADVGSPAGDGVISRLTEDDEAFDIESATPEVKVFEVTLDVDAGSPEEEQTFRVTGKPFGKDFIETVGSGTETTLKAASARDSNQTMQNASFSDFVLGTPADLTSVTSIAGWTPGTNITNFDMEQTDFFRGFQGDPLPTAVKFLAIDSLEQAFSVRNITVDPNVPFYFRIAYRPLSSADGTLTITLGSQTESVTVSGTAWQLLTLTPSKGWYDNFNQQNNTIKIEWTARTAGQLLVDDVIFVPMTLIDGTWWVAVGGQTPWLREDTIDATDTATDAAIIQRWLVRTFGFYLPHSGTPSWVDPT